MVIKDHSLKSGRFLGLMFLMFLSLALDSYSQGLPQEYYVTQRWRDLFSSHSPATNPAFMTEENYLTFRGALCPTLQGSFLLGELGFVLPVGLYQSVGVTVLGLSTRDPITKTDWINNELVTTNTKYPDNHYLFLFSYAINPYDRLSIGVNGNFYTQSNFGSPINGVSADIGASYRLLRHSLLGDHVIGLTYQNVISPDLQFKNPMRNTANIKLSWIGKLWEKRIDAGVDVDAKDLASSAKDFAKDQKVKRVMDYNARVGGWVLRLFNIYGLFSDKYWGIAGGMNVPTVNNGRDFQVAYQYLSMLNESDITTMHTAYIRLDVGKHREELYARRMARLASIGPGDLYNKARTLFTESKYYDAMYLFGKILTEYPDFFKNDWVRLFYGECQENLDMREFSAENYNEAKKAFPRSVIIPYADLGLLRLAYRDNNSSMVANQFSKLNNSSVPDSLKFHAYYYQGEQFIRDNDPRKAIQILQQIPQNHPEYPFAQHSLAIAFVMTNDAKSALTSLDNVAQSIPAKSKQHEEIIFRSFVFLGYVYYEGAGGVERSLAKAVSALRKVPATSYYYEDALLGMAWTGLAASQWNDCIAACNELATKSQNPVNQCEAQLLIAYCAMVEKKYTDALNILAAASDKVAGIKPPTEAELNASKIEYDNNRGNYYEISSRANELALTSQSSVVLQQIDSLKAPQIEAQKKLSDYYKYVDEFGRRAFFTRNYSAVKNDIDYALAVAQRMVGQSGAIKIQEKTIQKTNEIDEEMKKLQEQLNNLNKDTTSVNQKKKKK